MAFGLAEVNIGGKGLQGREGLVELGRALESKGMSKYPKLHSIFKVQVPHMQEARFNSRWEPTISRLKGFVFFLVRAQRVRKIVPRIPESQLQAQAFGSVDQTDDRRKLSMQ